MGHVAIPEVDLTYAGIAEKCGIYSLSEIPYIGNEKIAIIT